MSYCFESELKCAPDYEGHVVLAVFDAEDLLEEYHELDECSVIRSLQVTVAITTFDGARWLTFGDREGACEWLDEELVGDGNPDMQDIKEDITCALRLLTQ